MSRATAAVLLAALTLLSISPAMLPAGAMSGTVPDEVGHHMVMHIQAGSGWPYSALMAAVDADGELVMYAYSLEGDVVLSDGYDADGEIIERRFSVPRDPMFWTRYDLVFEGDTYRFEMGQTFRFEGASLTYANEAAPVDDARFVLPRDHHEPPPKVGRVRLDAGDGSLESTFTRPWEDTAWSPVVTGGTLELHEKFNGHQSAGNVELLKDPADEAVAYVHTDVTGFGGVYSAEISVLNNCIVGAPGVAVLAGLADATTDPTVNWGLLLTRPGLGDLDTHTCGLTFVAPSTVPRPLPVTLSSDWHAVSIDLDEAAGTLAVRVDGAPVAVIDDVTLGTSTHVAAGDLNPTLTDVSTFVQVFYDDAAVYPTT